jgi:hypothetical protein
MKSLDTLRSLTQREGFLHVLASLVITEAYFPSLSDLQNRNRFDLISFHEITILLALLAERNVSANEVPPRNLDEECLRCKAALDSLHNEISTTSELRNIQTGFSEAREFIEPFFYSASSAYWFDYLELAPKLYELDAPFLERCGYPIGDFCELLRTMHSMTAARIRDYARTERRNYVKSKPIRSPLQCFMFTASDFPAEEARHFQQFVDRFSLKSGQSPQLLDPLPYHPAKSRPSLLTTEMLLFAPVAAMLCEQIYESPFYAIAEDKNYFAEQANNRGICSERILLDAVSRIRGFEVTHDVRLMRNSQEIGQIDVAAAFGSIAILFEIKTKRLTEASKNGNTSRLLTDIRAGIIDAQSQLARNRSLLLNKTFDRAVVSGSESPLFDNTKHVICISVMAHEIPSYPLLIRTLMAGERESGILALTIFDLRIICHYLSNPFDFTYYMAARLELDDALLYNTEQALLAFHLQNRLILEGNVDSIYIDDGIGQQIDADYPLTYGGEPKLAMRFGVKIIDGIIEQLIATKLPEYFRAFSVLRGMNKQSAIALGKLVLKIVVATERDRRTHDASMMFGTTVVTFVVGVDSNEANTHGNRVIAIRDQLARHNFTEEFFIFISPGIDTAVTSNKPRYRCMLERVTQRRSGFNDQSLLALPTRLASPI